VIAAAQAGDQSSGRRKSSRLHPRTRSEHDIGSPVTTNVSDRRTPGLGRTPSASSPAGIWEPDEDIFGPVKLAQRAGSPTTTQATTPFSTTPKATTPKVTTPKATTPQGATPKTPTSKPSTPKSSGPKPPTLVPTEVDEEEEFEADPTQMDGHQVSTTVCVLLLMHQFPTLFPDH
jgi:hypothetical protein